MVSIPLGITVEEAVNLMREHDISQVPVVEGGESVGSISEARILDILVSNPGARLKPVVEYMERPFPVVADEASLTDVAQCMDRDTSAVLVKVPGGGFDIITKSDLIFFLTRKDGGKG
jgi:cystathionine beta-synthase